MKPSRPLLVILLSALFLDHEVSAVLDDSQFSHEDAVQSATVNTSLIAPYYHPVTAGSAWVFPKSDIDLDARGMSCECFDPDSKFLISTSTSNSADVELS